MTKCGNYSAHIISFSTWTCQCAEAEEAWQLGSSDGVLYSNRIFERGDKESVVVVVRTRTRGSLKYLIDTASPLRSIPADSREFWSGASNL
jgi:hypothetical protein